MRRRRIHDLDHKTRRLLVRRTMRGLVADLPERLRCGNADHLIIVLITLIAEPMQSFRALALPQDTPRAALGNFPGPPPALPAAFEGVDGRPEFFPDTFPRGGSPWKNNSKPLHV